MKRWTDDWGIRWYKHDDIQYIMPSVTSILDRVLSYQAKKTKDKVADVANYKKRKENSAVALDRGSTLHEIFANILNGIPVSVPLELKPDVDAFRKYLLDIGKYEVIKVEEGLYHPDLYYAGSMDAIVKVNDSIELWDYKTGRGYSANTSYQMAAYALAAERLWGLHIDKTRGIHVNGGNLNTYENPRAHGEMVWFNHGILYKSIEYATSVFMKAFEVFKADKMNLLLKYGVKDPDSDDKYFWDIDTVLHNGV